MDEVFGEDSFHAEIKFKTTGGHSSFYIPSVSDSILWYGRTSASKYRALYFQRRPGEEGATQYKYGEAPDGRRAPLTWFEQQGITPRAPNGLKWQ
jgi:adenine-specific DNA-methyltransferase